MESPLSLIAGGTGLVGSHVIKMLSNKPGSQIILARSFDLEIPQNAELQIINFDDLKKAGNIKLECKKLSELNYIIEKIKS